MKKLLLFLILIAAISHSCKHSVDESQEIEDINSHVLLLIEDDATPSKENKRWSLIGADPLPAPSAAESIFNNRSAPVERSLFHWLLANSENNHIPFRLEPK